ncbi:MAG: hypothetical protein PHP26_02445 [Syntrophomonas sp.]|uniref:hypothetical protein n=1 Tax=Syntrophomonas sp. TaxID=2053627 RepID=UPI002604C636|nr:hypothetical protein [Syntrophomonas sp.]MDD2509762.1 hypothetical protein [Syntrophomonas sp.]MDD3878834.1 hypothetical protein [Syntrophomonas sp.]MDD4625745.1 hypothetical protein [Syntrophomonas sp.]
MKSAKHDKIVSFNGISNNKFKGFKVSIDLFTDELYLRAPAAKLDGISYKFENLTMLRLDRREKGHQDILDINIAFPDGEQTETVIISREDAYRVLIRYKFFKDGANELRKRKTEFEEMTELKNVALIEFTRNKDVRNYNYGTLILAQKEMNFISYNGKNFILHLDELDSGYYYHTVVLPTDILGYSRWISVHRVSDLKRDSLEIVTFMSNEVQAGQVEKLFAEHYAQYLENKMKLVQQLWQDFNQRIEEQYQALKSDPEAKKLAGKFVEEKGDAVLLNPDTYWDLDYLMEKKRSNAYVNILAPYEEDIELSPEVKTFFEDSFLPFYKLLVQKPDMKNEVALLAVWKLLKASSLECYREVFCRQFPHFLEGDCTWQECINHFYTFFKPDIPTEKDLALLSYFMMANYWKNEDNFTYYYQTIKESQINAFKES